MYPAMLVILSITVILLAIWVHRRGKLIAKLEKETWACRMELSNQASVRQLVQKMVIAVREIYRFYFWTGRLPHSTAELKEFAAGSWSRIIGGMHYSRQIEHLYQKIQDEPRPGCQRIAETVYYRIDPHRQEFFCLTVTDHEGKVLWGLDNSFPVRKEAV